MVRQSRFLLSIMHSLCRRDLVYSLGEWVNDRNIAACGNSTWGLRMRGLASLRPLANQVTARSRTLHS